jgi:hypothetical protein
LRCFISLHKALATFAQSSLELNRVARKCPQLCEQYQATCSRQFLNRQPLLSPFFSNTKKASYENIRPICHQRKSLLRATLIIPRRRTLVSKLPNPPSVTTMLSALQNPRQAAAQLLNFALILSTAFMMWKGLSVIADSPSPIVVVLSGSMEPAFQRGDLLFLWNRNLFAETKVGEIVVYNVKGKDIPIVHRVVRKFGLG